MFTKILVFFTLICFGYCIEIVPNYNDTEVHLIAGGYVPQIDNYAKYTVSIANLDCFDEEEPRQFGRGHWCGGSIIGLKVILTAAHCVFGRDPKTLVVIAGTPRRTKKYVSTQIMYVHKVITHPKFMMLGDGFSPHDIALLHLEKILLEDRVTVKRIGLPPKSYGNKGQKCLLVGWGWLGTLPPAADLLRSLDMVVTDKRVCKQFLKIDKSFCAAPPEGKAGGGCTGDSGGPLFCKGYVAGVAIVALNCTEPLPTYFTDVSEYVDWIKKNSPARLHFELRGINRAKSAFRVSSVLLLIVCLIDLIASEIL